jgi:FtsH-binding integral membrane protein
MDGASEEGKRGAISGALRLYLDFINLFLMMLRFFGNRR